MVGHQNIGMEVNFMFLAGLAEMVKIELIIIVREEASTSIIAPLNDVQWNYG